MTLTDYFLEIVCQNQAYQYYKINDSIYLKPKEEFRYFSPTIFIKNVNALELGLRRYLSIIKSGIHPFHTPDYKHDLQNLFFQTIRCLSNDNALNFTEYLNRYCDFITDKTFQEFTNRTIIGKLDDIIIHCKNKEAYYNMETPYVMHFDVEVPGLQFEMPLIRYGISQNICYLYAIQRKKKYNLKNKRLYKMNSYFNALNKSIKNFRNVPPTMIASVIFFLNLLNQKNIDTIIAYDFLTRRYGFYPDVTNEEERNRIQTSATNQFLHVLLRIADQIDGVDITRYPLDCDSALELKINNELTSSNDLARRLLISTRQVTK